MKIFKIILSVVFIVLAMAWIFVSLDILEVYNIDWQPLDDIKSFALSFAKTNQAMLGLKLLLIGGSVFLAFNGIGIVLGLIPLLGKILKVLWVPIKWIVGGLANLAAIGLIVGGVFLMMG